MKKFLLTAGNILIGLLIVALSYGQEQQLTVFGTADGLSDNSISDIHQDKSGYLWVATGHGLNLYNGIDFRIFRHNPEDTTSIRANSLATLYEDPQSNIWVTLNIGGISKYNRKEDRFQYFTHNPQNGGDPNNFINDILVDSQNETWIATSTHINLLDTLTGLYSPVQIDGYESLEIHKIFEDVRRNLWLGTDKGLFRKRLAETQFLEVQDVNGATLTDILHFVENTDNELWLSSNYQVYQMQKEIPVAIKKPHDRFITNLFTTQDGSILISQYEDHIYEWNGDTWQILTIPFTNTDQLRHAFSNKYTSLIIIEDNLGSLDIYDKSSGETRKMASFKSGFSSFSLSNTSNDLWVGTDNAGLFQINIRTPYISQYKLNSPNPDFAYIHYTSAMVALPDNDLIVNEGSSLYRYNIGSGDKQQLASPDISTLNRSGVSYMTALNDRELLIASGLGIHKLNLNTYQSTALNHVRDQRTYELLIKGNILWSIGQYGLASLNLQTAKITFFKDFENTPSPLSNGNVRSIFIDSQNSLWVGTVREGLFKVEQELNGEGYIFKNYRFGGVRKGPFISHTVNDILEDKNGRLWIASFSNGLLEFDRERESFINHNPAQELPIPNIQALELVADGSLWMSAINGIHRYDVTNKAFHKFTTRDGLTSTDFTLRSSAHSSDGSLLFGSNKGFAQLNPVDFKPEPRDHKVLIEALQVNTGNTIFKEPGNELRQSLNYQQRFIAFDFISLDYHTPEKISYQYRLKGLETNWNTSKSRHVQYANLSRGDYTFQVRAGSNGGNWSDEYTSLAFTITQPFWSQLWFQTLVLISIALIAYGIYRFRIKLKQSKAQLLEDIRQSTAADFHDEMGNKLTRIALFSEVLEQKLHGSSPEISSYVNKIKDNSHVLNNSMRDFLWALDPAKDTAFDLVILLKDFGDELFESSGVHFHGAAIKEVLQQYPLDMDWKRHLVMIFKEAMHNALKYSMARNVTLKATLSKDVLNLSLTDDGQGFDAKEIDNGYGQANMKRRAEHLEASLSIESTPGIGTIVTFIGTLTKKHETYD